MDAALRDQLISEWINHHAHPVAWDSNMVLRPQSLSPQAVETMDQLSFTDPKLTWDLLIEIVHASQNDDVMMHAGLLLQRLLESHPADFVERVESTARIDPQFKELLGWLLPLDANAELWQRVRRVAGDVKW